jgi:hypothetical protein
MGSFIFRPNIKSHNFHFGITTITPLITLIILSTSTQHAHLTSRVSLRSAKRPSAQFANSTKYKFSTKNKCATNNVLLYNNALQALECYSSTSSQGRALVKQASIATYLTRFAVKCFPMICSMQENKAITTNELRTRTNFHMS